MRRFLLAATMLAASTIYALAGGTISLFGAIQLDTQGKVMAGCRLFTLQAGTTNPQSSFQDSSLLIAHPNPVLCDASGRLPFGFLADGFIKIRLETAAGVTMLSADSLLVVGPSGGGGGGSVVDPTTTFSTGAVQAVYQTGSKTGWVRMNGRTAGNAVSGASERANADVEALFCHLWQQDPNLTVSTGRGASCAADFAASKTIQLPDFRGRIPGALDDMGNSAAGRLTATYFGTSAIVLGAAGGTESHTLTTAQLPVVTPAGSVSAPTINDPGHPHNYNIASGGGLGSTAPIIGDDISATLATNSATTGITANAPTFTGTPFGSGSAHKTVQPTILVTFYIKL